MRFCNKLVPQYMNDYSDALYLLLMLMKEVINKICQERRLSQSRVQTTEKAGRDAFRGQVFHPYAVTSSIPLK